MPKQCKNQGCKSNAFGGGYCKFHQYQRSDKKPVRLKRKPISRKVSTRLQNELRIYSKLRKDFLKGKKCAVYPWLDATEVHHKIGRGIFLNDVTTWLAVSRPGHIYIEEHPEEAKFRGWSLSRLSKVRQN